MGRLFPILLVVVILGGLFIGGMVGQQFPVTAPTTPLPTIGIAGAGFGGAGGGFGGASGASGTPGAGARPVQGQVARIDGDVVVLTGAQGEQRLRVDENTVYHKTTPITRADITPGTLVSVTGRSGEGGAIVATIVNVVAPGSAAAPAVTGGQLVTVQGTVSRIDASSLVLATDQGEKTITLGEQTRFTRTEDASLADLGTGTNVVASGRPGTDGVLIAATVTIQPAGGFGGAGGAGSAPGSSGTPGAGGRTNPGPGGRATPASSSGQ